MTLDPAVADLLKAIDAALVGNSDWNVVAVRRAVQDAQVDDPGDAADWLRAFLARREEARS